MTTWRGAVRGAGATAPDEEIDAAGRAVAARWAEPHRRYHTRAHLDTVLSNVDTLAPHAVDADLVRLAAWFHDAVYDPRASGNEEASAALAGQTLTGLGVPDEAAAEVRRLVLLTAGHAVEPGDRNGELLCDADLAILAAVPEAYDEYAARIRAEYAHVPDELYRVGRATVLRNLLELPKLYRIMPVWEPRARANLRRELGALTAP